MNHPDYYTEDELNRLIEFADKNPVCKVPDYLKDQILRKTAEHGMHQHTASLLPFATKVTAAAVAAIVLLFAMPEPARLDQFFTDRYTAESHLANKQQENSLLNQLNQRTRQLCDLWSETTNSIMFEEDFK